ncbi:hypothetical protein H5410_063871 [Solanum commersonii]|uniref:DUF4216 domain-containing protein n=1 Tax=Solanum commersonii TaxID=4109 RepID=A0A9J5WEE3_SOLCO|nr:hypothetical protein H5410_063871 [Solanum commersonii]
MNIKSDWNGPNAAMDSMADLLGELVNLEINIPKNVYQAKHLVSKLGLTYDRIQCCVNGCMLFCKTNSELENCKVTSDFYSHYFGNDVPCRRNRPNHNDEGDIDPSFSPISIFNRNGRGSKKCGKRSFTSMEMQSTVTYILLNFPEIQPYLKLFVNTWGNEAIYTEFSKCLTKYIMNKYCVNGFKFQTEEVSRNKKTNNIGVFIQGDVDGTGQTIEYYGVIHEIIEVRYLGWPKNKIVLFRCKWFDLSHRGTKVDQQHNIIEVKQIKK